MCENPYESPAAIESGLNERSTSVLRGLGWAVAIALVGFIIPLALAPFTVAGAKGPWEGGLRRAFLLAVIFGGGAFANFTPTQGIGFVRSAIVVSGLIMVNAMVGGVILAFLLPLPLLAYSGSVNNVSVAVSVIFNLVLLVEIALFTTWQARRSKNGSLTESQGHQRCSR